MANRPQPQFPEPNTQPFWDGVKAGELRYQSCDDCNNIVFYPRQQRTSPHSNRFSTSRSHHGIAAVKAANSSMQSDKAHLSCLSRARKPAAKGMVYFDPGAKGPFPSPNPSVVRVDVWGIETRIAPTGHHTGDLIRHCVGRFKSIPQYRWTGLVVQALARHSQRPCPSY